MDTSETYIKMCEKAEEVQKEWLIHSGDFFFDKQSKYEWTNPVGVVGDEIIIEVTKRLKAKEFKQNNIWLPRQDQLQEMVEEEPLACIDGIKNFWVEINFPNFSWEQLWFAFVMKEKFNKVWSGTDWVKENP